MVQHPWVSGGCRNELELELPIRQVVQTHVIPSLDHMDPDVLASMTSLGCFKDRERLNRELLSPTHNMEKVIYFLLLDRKRRRPACEDDDESLRSRPEADPPRKRIDSRNGQTSASCENLALAQGSPFAPRRFPNGVTPASKLYVHCTPNHLRRSMRQGKNGSSEGGVGGLSGVKPGFVSMIKSMSPANVLGSSTPLPSPRTHRQRTSSISLPGNESPAVADTPPGSPGLGSGVYWRSRLNIFKNSIIGTPRFHRRKMQG